MKTKSFAQGVVNVDQLAALDHRPDVLPAQSLARGVVTKKVDESWIPPSTDPVTTTLYVVFATRPRTPRKDDANV